MSFFFNIQSFLSRSDCALNMVEYLEFRVIQELAERYPDLGLESEPHLTSALEKIYSVHRKGFVFIIDEWDCVFREKKSDVDAQTKYLDFLRDLLKDKVYVKLAYMTGILPIKKYGTHSALNMFDEFSMTNPKYLHLMSDLQKRKSGISVKNTIWILKKPDDGMTATDFAKRNIYTVLNP